MTARTGIVKPVRSSRFPDGDVTEIALLEEPVETLVKVSSEVGWGFSATELAAIKDHFAGLGRDPRDIEMEALAQGWSEHCCYKTSKQVLRRHVFGIEEQRVLLREDAGIMKFDDEHVYAVRIESHNHPSAVEPYGGAATGVGGILRDIACMGAQPIALCDMIFFGPPDLKYADLPRGVKHPVYLTTGVLAGIRDYGNRVGIPNVTGSIHFHPQYTGNCLVNAGCLGIARKEHVTRSRSGPAGSLWILAGGKTGRDGIHGVTFASRELTEGSDADVPAVQLGDPITEEPLIHACLDAVHKGLVLGMKDLGGGGLSCATGEMSEAGGVGADIELTKVHTKAGNMKPWEIWVSESQERMMLSVAPENEKAVHEIFQLWDVAAVTLGKATPGPEIVARWHGEPVFELDPAFVYGGPEVDRPMEAPTPQPRRPDPSAPSAWDKALLDVLADPNVCCRAPLLRFYDHTVRASTVLPPWVGQLNADGHGDAAVLKPLAHSWRGLAVAAGVNPAHTAVDAYRGSLGAMDEVSRNLACVGARIDTISDCLNFPNPQKPTGMWTLEESCRALGEAARALKVPFVSGNISLYNESHAGPVPATPTLMGVGIVPDVRKVVSSDLKGHDLVLVGATRPEFGGSVFSRLAGAGGEVPGSDLAMLPKSIDAVVAAIQNGLVTAAHDPSEGGLAVALAEMGFGALCGFEVDLGAVHASPEVALFSESNTRWVLETREADDLVAHMQRAGVPAVALGASGGDSLVFKHKGRILASLPHGVARERWHGALARYFTGGGS